jgi:hypothetical protein
MIENEEINSRVVLVGNDSNTRRLARQKSAVSYQGIAKYVLDIPRIAIYKVYNTGIDHTNRISWLMGLV